MRVNVLFAILLGAVVVSCSSAELDPAGKPASAESGRADGPAMKGMELYSWKPDGEDWHFNILVGTNRNKSDAEKRNPDQEIIGLEELKKHLAQLAEGEHLFWQNLAEEAVPEDMVENLKTYCLEIKVNLKLLGEE